MKLSLFDSHKDATPKSFNASWLELTQLLKKLHGTEKYGPAWSPASYPPETSRAKANVEEVAALVLDLDKLSDAQLVQVETDLARFSYLAHESYSSAPESRCCRFVIELSRPVKASEWPRFWTQAVDELCVPADKSTSDASRLYFLPARPQGEATAFYVLDVHAGEVLDVDDVLGRAPDEKARVEPAGALEHGPIPQGQRDTTLHRYAGAMRRSGFEVPEIAAALHVMNEKRCSPPLEPEEVERLAASAQRYAIEDDQQGMQEFIALLDSRRKVTKHSDGYIIDLIEFFEQFDANRDDKDLWLIKGILGKGVPQIMAGPPKSHKSWTMYSQALSLSSGRKWLEEFEVQRCKVLVMSHEDRPDETHRRIFRLAKGSKIDPRDIRGWLSVNAVDPFKFNHQSYVDELRKGIESWQPECIFMDSLSRSHTADENSAQDMNIVTQTWNDLCKEYGIAIVIVHHFGKTEGGSMLNRMRGTSDLGAVVRHAIGITKLEIDDPNFQGGISKLEFEGNLPGMSEAFSMGIRDGMVGNDKAVYMEYRSEAKQESFEQVKRDFLGFLAASEPEPQTKSAICNSTRAGHSTVKNTVLAKLLEEGAIVQHGKKYRMADPS